MFRITAEYQYTGYLPLIYITPHFFFSYARCMCFFIRCSTP